MKKRLLRAKQAPRKHCRACRRLLPLADFHRQADSPDGRRYVCKECRARLGV